MATFINCLLCGREVMSNPGDTTCCRQHEQEYREMVKKHGDGTPELKNAIKAYREEQRQKEAEAIHEKIIRESYAAKAAQRSGKKIAKLREAGKLGKPNIFLE